MECPYLFFDTKLGHFNFMNLIAKVHKKKKPFKCDICFESFKKKVTLKHKLNQFMKKNIHMWHLSLQQLPKGWLEVRSWNGSWKEETIQLWHFWLQLFPKELLEETFWSFHEKKKSFKCSIYDWLQMFAHYENKFTKLV